jgi:hypothetical protein
MSNADQWALVIAWSVAWIAVLVGLSLADSGRARSSWLSRMFNGWSRGLEAGAQLLVALLERSIRRAFRRGRV